jgi:hypothetical protein
MADADVGKKAMVGVAVLMRPVSMLAELVVAVLARLVEANTLRRAVLLWLLVMARVSDCVGWLEFATVVRPETIDSEEDSLNAAFAFEGRSAVMLRGASAN